MKIELPCCTNTGFEVVEAELLSTMAPHLASVSTFALHRGLPTDSIYKDMWFVSNVESGRFVSRDFTRTAVIKKATEKLADKTPSMICAVYRKFAE